MLTIALDSELMTTFDPRSLIYLFDMIGIVACSISGTILAKHKNFDVFGCLLVSIVTAIGGGTVLDIGKLLVFGGNYTCGEIFEKGAALPRTRTLVAVPTTCGTGSEVTCISIAEI